MSKIQLPPPGLGGDKGGGAISTCVSSTGGDSLEIDIVSPGYFFHTPDGYFNPELPSGKLNNQDRVFYPTVSSGTAYLVYFDISTQKLYLVFINIQVDPCISDSKRSKG